MWRRGKGYLWMKLPQQLQGSWQLQRLEAVHGCVKFGQGQRLLCADDDLQLCAHLQKRCLLMLA